MMRSKTLLMAAAGACLISYPANAAVEISTDVNGLGTFVDTNTGRQWLRLDNFFNVSANQMIATATASGFTVATLADLQALFGSLNNPGTNFAAYSNVMGSAPNRGLIWGAYGDITATNLPWAFAFNFQNSWQFGNGANAGFGGDSIPNRGSREADMNLWAFRTASNGAVPEPTTWAMMILGFGFVGGAMRSAKRLRKVSVAYS